MSDLISGASDVALALQSSSVMSTGKTRLGTTLSAAGSSGKDNTGNTDDDKARETANKFEALLVHSMLKSMRKTTMSENKSNDRAIYDDMLDEQLADTMIKSGGLGIADQIVAQIREQQGRTIEPNANKSDAERLRELAAHIKRPAPVATGDTNNQALVAGLGKPEIKPTDESTAADPLRLAAGLWGNTRNRSLTAEQNQFISPLVPHATRNAQRLGTSPNAILAIAALETGWGQSVIEDADGNSSHNLFGIKAVASDNGYATTLTTEYVNGTPLKQQANFKTFDNAADAVDGFADFILANPRYSNALKHAGNSERFLEELQSAGYATDPRYADKAKSIMRQIARN